MYREEKEEGKPVIVDLGKGQSAEGTLVHTSTGIFKPASVAYQDPITGEHLSGNFDFKELNFQQK